MQVRGELTSRQCATGYAAELTAALSSGSVTLAAMDAGSVFTLCACSVTESARAHRNSYIFS